MRSISIPAQERQALRERYASVGSPYTQPQSSLIALHRAFASLPDALLGELSTLTGTASTALPLPLNASLGGTVVSAQAVPFDLSLVGFALPVGSSDAIDIKIGN